MVSYSAQKSFRCVIFVSLHNYSLWSLSSQEKMLTLQDTEHRHSNQILIGVPILKMQKAIINSSYGKSDGTGFQLSAEDQKKYSLLGYSIFSPTSRTRYKRKKHLELQIALTVKTLGLNSTTLSSSQMLHHTVSFDDSS